MKRLQFIFLALSLLIILPGALSAGLITNGGFETGDFTGWTQSGNTSFTLVNNSIVHSGTWSAQFGPVGSLGYITQTIDTTPGASYDLTFWLANGGGTPSFFNVAWGGIVIGDISNPPSFSYTVFSYGGLTATGTTTDVTFGFQQNPNYLFLDDVDVNAADSAIPEPSSMTLAGLGMAALLAFALRRRKQQV